MITISRRTLLLVGTGAGLALWARPWLPRIARATTTEFQLEAKPDSAPLVGAAPLYPATPVWCYNGNVPGPEIRVRQGERARIEVKNGLDQETTVHCHGIRLPNHMDGVPHLTQRPIAPGETFVYEFAAPDAGTYWYHPHLRSFEQVGRGLYGPLIVEELEPIQVDRDLTWVLDDWRLTDDAEIDPDFNRLGDVSHGGRIGNTVTLNGRLAETFPVRSGERLRLRLINGANARIFALEFAGHEPRIIAIDGQPVQPHSPEGGRVTLAPAMRMDLILDMTGQPGSRFQVTDTFYRSRAYELLKIVYASEPPLRKTPLESSIQLAANPIPEPDPSNAERFEVVFGGGVHGGMKGAMLNGQWTDLRSLAHQGKMWAINGVVATGHVMKPLLTLRRGRSYVLALRNDTAWHHPMHLHGHSFRVITRNGQPTRYREWQDTVLMAPREQVEVAFVADNPGDWMFHCHILEHQAGGMMGVIRVSDGENV